MTSIQKSCAVPPEFFVSDERMIRMKLRQKGCSDTQREFLKRFQPSRMVIGIDSDLCTSQKLINNLGVLEISRLELTKFTFRCFSCLRGIFFRFEIGGFDAESGG